MNPQTNPRSLVSGAMCQCCLHTARIGRSNSNKMSVFEECFQDRQSFEHLELTLDFVMSFNYSNLLHKSNSQHWRTFCDQRFSNVTPAKTQNCAEHINCCVVLQRHEVLLCLRSCSCSALCMR